MRRTNGAARRRKAVTGMYISWDAGGNGDLTNYEATNTIGIPFGHEFGDSSFWAWFNQGTNFANWNTWVGAKPGRRFTYSCPLLTSGDDTGLTIAQKYTQLAAGTYNSNFTSLGNAFQAQPNLRNAIVRLGWEFNGSTRAWAVPPSDQTTLDNYKAGFNQAAGALKAACPTLQIEWCPNTQLDYTQRTFADMYPGDTWIDYVGIGLYDYYWPAYYSVTDDFATANATRWTFDTGTSVTGGQLVTSCTTAYPTVKSTGFYDLTDSSLAVELVQSANTANTGAYTLFGLDVGGIGNTNSLVFYVNGTNLVASRWVGGVSADNVVATYSPTNHRRWRIREANGVIYWDAAPATGDTWTNLFSWTRTFAVTNMSTRMGAGYGGTGAAPGNAIWDNFNAFPTKTQREAWIRDGVNGLADQVALARAHGKRLCHTEWGLWPVDNSGGGGDRPAFIDFIADWYTAYGYTFHVYNNAVADGDHRLDSNPNAKARYLARFS